MQNFSRTQSSRHGFTLTELTIVLCVAGLLLAAVWGAASTVRDNHREAAASRQVMTVAQGLRDYHLHAPGIKVADLTNITPAIADRFSLPPEMRVSCSSKICLNSAFSVDPQGSFRIVAHNVTGGVASQFAIVLLNLTRDECIRMLFHGINYRDQILGIKKVCASPTTTTSTHPCLSESGPWANVRCSGGYCDLIYPGEFGYAVDLNSIHNAAKMCAGNPSAPGNVSEAGWVFDVRR